MNVGTQAQTVNVVPLFGELEISSDPLQDLLNEAMEESDEMIEETISVPRLLVREDQSLEQSLYVLEEQLSQLKRSLGRIKFYLGDLDDLLPL
jgi:hypothetical protein